MLSFDFLILDFIQSHFRSAFGDFIMPLVSALGNGGILWIAFALILIITSKYRKVGIIIFIALILHLLICNLAIKPLVARPRPFTINTDISLLITAPKDYSFPSGHTAASFATVFVLLFCKNKLWKWTLLPAILIAFSRLYLYVHYPTDVFAGVFIGLFLGFAAYVIYNKAQNCMSRKNK